ncbi:MAG: hypothetical protein AAGI38_13370 [Bacteroidota bacterium]
MKYKILRVLSGGCIVYTLLAILLNGKRLFSVPDEVVWIPMFYLPVILCGIALFLRIKPWKKLLLIYANVNCLLLGYYFLKLYFFE